MKRSSRHRVPKPPEREVQRSCIAVLESLGCKVERRNAGSMFGEHKGKRWAARLGESGAADLFARLPNGIHIDVEVKADGKRPALHQVRWLREANRWAPAFWVDGAEQLEAIVPALMEGAKVVWGSGTELYRVETKGPDGKRTAHWVSGPSAEFEVEY